jgi:Brp/Blh family beta-carotene 15,15'-monooxygenase
MDYFKNMNNYELDRFHSVIFFILTILLTGSGLFDDIYNLPGEKKIPDNFTIICFFLIATVGVSHGALDNLKGAKLLKKFKIKNISIFYLSYLVVVSLVILFWIIFPTFTIVMFLILASYHFGKEDNVQFYVFEKMPKIKFKSFFLFLKGSIVISAPLFWSPIETFEIFEVLNVGLNVSQSLIGVFIVLGLASNYFLNEYWGQATLDTFSVLFLNLVFHPLIAFTLYFCFLHSIRHSISLMHELNKKDLKKGLHLFLKKAIPLTTITAFLFLLGIFLLNNYYSMQVSILKVIFIGLASLTFPHILLEYLLEKNEKRT